jgi:hypothetical protein
MQSFVSSHTDRVGETFHSQNVFRNCVLNWHESGYFIRSCITQQSLNE